MKEVILIMSILSIFNGQVDTATATDITTEVETTEEMEVVEPTVDTGQIVDDRLYLSKEYTDKDINDCYSMLLSIRNCVILLIMTIFLFKAYEIMSKEFKKHFKA